MSHVHAVDGHLYNIRDRARAFKNLGLERATRFDNWLIGGFKNVHGSDKNSARSGKDDTGASGMFLFMVPPAARSHYP